VGAEGGTFHTDRSSSRRLDARQAPTRSRHREAPIVTPDEPHPDEQPAFPASATDHGSAITIGLPTTTRMVSLGGGVLAAVVGLAILVFGPGDFAADTWPRVLIGGALLAGGVASALRVRRQVTFDEHGISVQGPVSEVTLAWSDVDRLAFDEAFDPRQRDVGGSSSSVGPFTVRSGAGGRAGAAGGGSGLGITSRRARRAVTLAATTGAGTRETRLDGVTADEARAVLDLSRQRGWIPSDVEVEGDDGA
jgi:hypothetical protein